MKLITPGKEDVGFRYRCIYYEMLFSSKYKLGKGVFVFSASCIFSLTSIIISNNYELWDNYV